MTVAACGGREPIEVKVVKGRSYWWCTCGRSVTQPFCDGAHKGSGFSPLEYVAEEDGSVWFCACKRTEGPPLCDGSHKGL